MKRRAGLFLIGSMATFGLSAALKPSRRAAELYTPIDLESQIPTRFSDWRIDSSIIPVLPDPKTQANVNEVYAQTLARTYVNARHQHVMLSIAYGSDQGSDATQAHRPEICYAAQGFSIQRLGQVPLAFGGHDIDVARLMGRRGSRLEHITYWVTLNDKAVLPGMTRQLTQIRMGLLGQIPDGMLVRASTIGFEQWQAFEVQGRFLLQLHASLSDATRARYFGS